MKYLLAVLMFVISGCNDGDLCRMSKDVNSLFGNEVRCTDNGFYKHESCLKTFGSFLKEYQFDDKGWVLQEEGYTYTWATNKEGVTEWIYIAQSSKGTTFKDRVDTCVDDGQVLNVYRESKKLDSKGKSK